MTGPMSSDIWEQQSMLFALFIDIDIPNKRFAGYPEGLNWTAGYLLLKCPHQYVLKFSDSGLQSSTQSMSGAASRFYKHRQQKIIPWSSNLSFCQISAEKIHVNMVDRQRMKTLIICVLREITKIWPVGAFITDFKATLRQLKKSNTESSLICISWVQNYNRDNFFLFCNARLTSLR